MHNFFLSLCLFPSQIWKTLITLNLFKRSGQQLDEERLRFQYRSTRVYIVLLISTLVILATYRIVSVYTFSKSINKPSHSTFEHLHDQYADTLICPCSEISVSYSQFVSVEFTLHAICSSDFVRERWLNSISITGNFSYFDFRLVALAHFQLLSSFCELANDTLMDARSSFLTREFISSNIIPSDVFLTQTEVAVQLFQLGVTSDFIRLLQLVSGSTSGNALMTVYTSSWR